MTADANTAPQSAKSRAEPDGKIADKWRRWIAGDMPDDAFYGALMARIRPLLHHYIKRYGIPQDQISDVSQEVLLALIETGFLREFDPERGVSLVSFLGGFIWRCCATFSRKLDRQRVQVTSAVHEEWFAQRVGAAPAGRGSSPFRGSGALEEIDLDLDVMEEQADRDRRVAIARSFGEGRIDAALKEVGVSPSGSMPDRRVRKDERHKRGNPILKDIRLNGGLSRRQVADGIGMELWRYQAFETGKRKAPDSIYATVTRFVENARPLADFGWLREATCRSIVETWMDMLGVDSPTHKLMLRVTGMSEDGILGWYNATHKPLDKRLSRLAAAHEAVLLYVEENNRR